jgi:hypothetical protein
MKDVVVTLIKGQEGHLVGKDYWVNGCHEMEDYWNIIPA